MSEARIGEKFPRWMRDHVARYLASDGADGHLLTMPESPSQPVPILLLTTVGRRSGEKFVFPLGYGRAGNSYIVIASKGGAPKHPAWYLNLIANPRVEVQVLADKFPAIARVSDGDERTRLWRRMTEMYRPFEDYQNRAGGRLIPVVALDPVE